VILQSKLLALVNEVLGQTAKLRRGGLQATYFCPKCNHYKRKLEISLETGQYHCWVCHFRGTYLGSLLTKINAPRHYRSQLFELTKDVRLVRRKSKSETVEEQLSLPEDFISLSNPPKHDANFAEHMQEYRRAMAYLKNRGIGLEDICRYNIGYCEQGEYRDCVIIPSYDDEGKLNYFSSRYYYPHPWLKYKNAPFSKNIVGFECFVNYDAEIGVSLVEGCFDAIAIRNNAVPMFGTFPSRKLLDCLGLYRVKRVNICLDSDAIREALRIYEKLVLEGTAADNIHLLVLPEKDPSEMGFDWIHRLLTQSKPLTMDTFVRLKLRYS